MARPSITGETIVVQVEDDLLTWTDGLLSGTNRAYVKTAKELAEASVKIELTPFGPEIEAGLDKENPERALAAMMGVIPGRATILEAPAAVLDLLPFADSEDSEPVDEEGPEWIENDEDVPDADGVVRRGFLKE